MDTFPSSMILALNNTSLITIIIILIFCSAFFSMTETVFSSVSQAKIKTFVEDRKTGSKKALYCATHFDQTLTTLLVGNNIVNTAISVLSVDLFTNLLKSDDYVSLVSMLVSTILLLIFGEILPKTLGKKYNEQLCLILGPITLVISFVLYPIVIIFRGLQRLVTGKKIDQSVDEVTLETILDTMSDEGTIEDSEVKLMKNVLDLKDQSIENIMTPRIDMVALPINASLDEATKLFLDNHYSRIPVYEGDKDHIVGVLYEREFYAAIIQKKPGLTIKKLMHEAKFVNKTMTVDTLIRELQKDKVHLAIVLGEYGDTLGVVTMEDALEELVGEIYDEHDEGNINKPLIVKAEDNVYYVDEDVPVDELFDYLEIGDAPENETGKISTWVFEESESLPQVGEQVKYVARYTKADEDGNYKDYAKTLTFEISKIKDMRIERIKLTIADATEEEIETKEEEDSD